MKKLLIYLLCLTLFSACDLLQKKEEKPAVEEQGKPVARVLNKRLFIKDIPDFEAKGISQKDSAAIVDRFIKSWVLKQLLATRAEAQAGDLNEEVQRQIEDCRNTLIIHEFEKDYLTKTLDTSISDNEIRSYYDSHIQNFELRENIFKGIFVKIPKDAPRPDEVRALALSSKVKDLGELRSYCLRFADHFILEDSVWINFDDLVKNTPFNDITDKAEFLQKVKLSEKTDNSFIYFLRINDYKISSQVSPFEFVKGQIKSTLLNQRRIKLINKLKSSIYKEAEENHEFEIYTK